MAQQAADLAGTRDKLLAVQKQVTQKEAQVASLENQLALSSAEVETKDDALHAAASNVQKNVDLVKVSYFVIGYRCIPSWLLHTMSSSFLNGSDYVKQRSNQTSPALLLIVIVTHPDVCLNSTIRVALFSFSFFFFFFLP